MTGEYTIVRIQEDLAFLGHEIAKLTDRVTAFEAGLGRIETQLQAIERYTTPHHVQVEAAQRLIQQAYGKMPR